MGDRALNQALRRRYRGHAGRLLRKRSRELQGAGDRNVRELRARQTPSGERALLGYKFPRAGTEPGGLLDSFARPLRGTTIA